MRHSDRADRVAACRLRLRMRFSRRLRYVITLERLIRAKTAAGRPKDKWTLPILAAALQEQRDRDKGT